MATLGRVSRICGAAHYRSSASFRHAATSAGARATKAADFQLSGTGDSIHDLLLPAIWCRRDHLRSPGKHEASSRRHPRRDGGIEEGENVVLALPSVWHHCSTAVGANDEI